MFFVVLALAAGAWTPVSGTWEPDAALVPRMRREVQAAFELRAPLIGSENPQWSSYAFQFQAGTWKARKTIFIHGVCERGLRTYDMTKWQMVSDGGPCFFQAKYDIDEEKAFDFMFNGPYVPSKPSPRPDGSDPERLHSRGAGAQNN